MFNQLKENYIFAVIRGKNVQDAVNIAKYAIKGGIKNIEITYTTPNAELAIEELTKLYSDDNRIIIGAGTVLNEEQVKTSVNAGAKFIVSPHFSKDILRLCNKHGIDYYPGALTPNEIIYAFSHNVKMIKIFPGSIVGPRYINDIHGPCPHIRMMPSGGVTLENIKDWRLNGAVCVGVGGALTKDINEKGYESVKINAKQFMDALEG
ncbi:bifunctional 4-hydroxy-2-oxoglutarate aldolase/2-dehydro-3-deoxy-phosphogluconate aldolase [Atopobacter phocae]|uniref:bifunctional 4-hydroxy-2-oxoglutarate aldolase/2-dehydro-3-deoxy-phosphogluconate aldolase n=1 Tax=Atopobacter phocae TaxID=136492 RepID=UPI00046EB6F5|nr:bifunctional 4-hydroxy-2-oxoglutarate aldolase/2-dehydro-3-deoxy-phosphogluconate aldolase [Atopobacter phocae]